MYKAGTHNSRNDMQRIDWLAAPLCLTRSQEALEPDRNGMNELGKVRWMLRVVIRDLSQEDLGNSGMASDEFSLKRYALQDQGDTSNKNPLLVHPSICSKLN